MYFASCDGRLYRVGAKTGEQDWTFQTPRVEGASTAVYASPLVSDDVVYFGSFDGHLYALKAKTGDLVWKFMPVEGSEVDTTPCTDGRRLFLGVRAGRNRGGFEAFVAIGEGAGR